MENKSHALAAGVFVLALAALLVGMWLWLTRDTVNRKAYEMITTSAVSGLQPQAAVRFRGVTVGNVTSVGFDPQAHSTVLVRLAIDADAPITDATYASLGYQGITGLSYVKLDEDGKGDGPPAMGPNGVPRIPLHADLLGQFTDQAGSLMRKMNEVLDSINDVFSPENKAAIGQSLQELTTAIASAQSLAGTAEKLFETQLNPDKLNIPALVQQAGNTLQNTDQAVVEIQAAVKSARELIETTREDLQRLTSADGLLGRLDEGSEIIMNNTLPGIQSLSGDAARTIRRLDRIIDLISENPQALLLGPKTIPPGPGEAGFEAPRTVN